MYVDEFRSSADLERVRKAHLFRDPDALYLQLKEIKAELSRSQVGGSGGSADQKRRISELFYALQMEREKTMALTSELADMREKLVSLRGSKTMKAGKLVKAPVVFLINLLSRLRFRSLL